MRRLAPVTIDAQYSQDAYPLPDETVQEAAALEPGQTIRLRVQPQVYLKRPGQYRTGMYLAWKGVYWNLACPTVESALGIRDVLTRVFTLLKVMEPAELMQLLDKRIEDLAVSPPSTATDVRIRS